MTDPFILFTIRSEGNHVPHYKSPHPVTAGRCAEKGKKLIDNEEEIWDFLEKRS